MSKIKQEVDLDKKGKNMSVTLPQPVKKILAKANERKLSPVTPSIKTMQDHQKIISAYDGIAIVSLIDIVAFDDINILYGYETGTHIVSEMQTMIENTLQAMDTRGGFRKHSVDVISYELYHVYGDKLCLFI